MSHAKNSTTTLTARDQDGVRVIEVDCPHGTTTGAYVNARTGLQLTDESVARALVLRHFLEERCDCTAALRRRFGIAAAEVRA